MSTLVRFQSQNQNQNQQLFNTDTDSIVKQRLIVSWAVMQHLSHKIIISYVVT